MSQNWQLVTRGSAGPRGPDSGWLSFSRSFGVHLSIHNDDALMGTVEPVCGLLCRSPVHLLVPLLIPRVDLSAGSGPDNENYEQVAALCP